jgi:transcriptional regulator with XRE-family HTH domain
VKKTLTPVVKNIIGKRVREARAKFNPPLSQDELATRLEINGWKISRGTLAKIESEIREVRDFEVVVLAKTLKVSVGWLLSDDE